VALHLDPQGEDPVRSQGGVRVTDLGSEHRLIRDGVEQLAHGALVCPSCAMPISIEAPVAIGAPISCGYCATAAPARSFLLRDVFDTAANEVLLVARLD
jgi:hypothetical protein